MTSQDNEAFLDIANALVREEANDYLNKRMAMVEKWIRYREERGERADLKNLIDKLMHEPNERGPVIVTLASALWRLREIEKEKANVPHEQ